jgi:putative membrane protein
MKRIISGVLVTSALVLGGTALAQAKTPSTTTTKAAGTAEYHGFMVPTDPKAFLERIHHVNQEEITQARLAQQNSTNEDVKSFAAQMIKDHTDADQKIQDLAKAQKLTLAEPKPANDVEKRAMAADKATLDKLQVLKGEPFDGCYMANQLGAHDATLGKLLAGKQALSGNAPLSSLIDDLIQSVSMHRQHAYTLLGKLSPAGSNTTSVGGSGDMTQPKP